MSKREKEDLTGLGDMLSKEEMEALAASRASTILERERKLADERVMEQEKEERSRKWRKRFALGALVLFILLLLVRCGTGELPIPEQIEDIWGDFTIADTTPTKDVEDVEVKDYDNSETLLTISMNKTPIFATGLSEGNLNIINDETNYYDQIVTIYTVDENNDPMDLIYTSGIIKVGETQQRDKLSVNLPAGVYSCVAYFNGGTTTETTAEDGTVSYAFKFAGKAGALITITVVESEVA